VTVWHFELYDRNASRFQLLHQKGDILAEIPGGSKHLHILIHPLLRPAEGNIPSLFAMTYDWPFWASQVQSCAL